MFPTTSPRRRLSALALIGALGLAAAACGNSSSSSSSSGSDGASGSTSAAVDAAGDISVGRELTDQVVIGWTGDANSFDPPFSSVEWNREISVNVYEPLVQYALTEADDGSFVWEGLEVAPGLAESWEVDGATVTFTLRDGVTFHPSGNPLTAEDVKYSFERTVAVPGGFGKFNANLAGIFDPASQIEVIDPLTVAITFTDAEGNPILLPASLPSMRFPQFGIVDSVAVKAQATAEDPWAAAWMKDNVAGTGPYFIASRTPNSETVLETVPGYWGEEPAFSRVVLRVTGGADMAALIKGGEIDFAAVGLSPRGYDDVADAGFAVVNQPIPNIVRADLAVDDGPLSDVRVRQAIAYAMPYDQIIAVALSGRGERATSYVNPQSPGFKDSWTQYETDPAKASELLEEAGVSDLDLPLFYDSGVVFNEDIALLVKDALSEVGIDVTPSPQPTTQFVEQRTARAQKADSAQSGMMLTSGVIWLDDPDPNTDVWFKSTGSSNWSHYVNTEVDELHAGFRFSPDADARAEAYEQVQDIIATEVPTVPLAVTGRTVALNPRLTGVSFTADPHTRFWTLRPKAS